MTAYLYYFPSCSELAENSSDDSEGKEGTLNEENTENNSDSDGDTLQSDSDEPSV